MAATMSLAAVILFAFFQTQPSPSIRGTVLDPAQKPVAQALVTLSNTPGRTAQSTSTGETGEFQFAEVPAGSYDLSISKSGFAVQHRVIRHDPGQSLNLSITLNLASLAEQVTVTAQTGLVEDVRNTPQQVTILEAAELQVGASGVLAATVFDSVGATMQRTSPTIGGIYVRGLTGKNVAVYVDGVRYTTSAQRGGINTFLNLNDPAELSRIEILRGPSSSQYGSDSLGGTINLLHHGASFSDTANWHGDAGVAFSSATMGAGSNLRTGYSSDRFGFVTTVTAKRSNTFRPGRGIDTHAAVTRFLGLPSTVFGERLTDTAFTQYGGNFRFNYALSGSSQLTVNYSRNQQDGGKRYDQTFGGDGNLIADLRNLMGDFFYTRMDSGYRTLFDTMSFSFSYNRQREERVNQGGNGNPNAGIVSQYERLNAFGLQWQGSRSINRRYDLHVSAEAYPERMSAPAFTFDPVTRTATPSRPRVPDRAIHNSGGVYTRHSVEALPNRLRLTGAVRWNAAKYKVERGALWPSDSARSSDLSGSVGAVATITSAFRIHFNHANGFRAPGMTDLGTLGLTGDGFEVSAADVAGLDAFVGSTADNSARSTGLAVAQIKSERTFNYETGFRFTGLALHFSATGFLLDLKDAVVKQALILPQGAVERINLGGQIVSQQTVNGAVFVPLSTTPVLVRTNLDHTRHYGWEMEADYRAAADWSLHTNATWVRAFDTATGLAPNIEGGTPSARGVFAVKYRPQRRPYDVQLSTNLVAPQSRFSTLDIADRRTGATRTRATISNYFNRAAMVHGLVRSGVLVATGETLAQVQDRVLGVGVNSSSLIRRLPGYVLLNLRTTFRIADNQDVHVGVENLTDRNYRGVNWGAPGIGVDLNIRYNVRF